MLLGNCGHGNPGAGSVISDVMSSSTLLFSQWFFDQPLTEKLEQRSLGWGVKLDTQPGALLAKPQFTFECYFILRKS